MIIEAFQNGIKVEFHRVFEKDDRFSDDNPNELFCSDPIYNSIYRMVSEWHVKHGPHLMVNYREYLKPLTSIGKAVIRAIEDARADYYGDESESYLLCEDCGWLGPYCPCEEKENEYV